MGAGGPIKFHGGNSGSRGRGNPGYSGTAQTCRGPRPIGGFRAIRRAPGTRRPRLCRGNRRNGHGTGPGLYHGPDVPEPDEPHPDVDGRLAHHAAGPGGGTAHPVPDSGGLPPVRHLPGSGHPHRTNPNPGAYPARRSLYFRSNPGRPSRPGHHRSVANQQKRRGSAAGDGYPAQRQSHGEAGGQDLHTRLFRL